MNEPRKFVILENIRSCHNVGAIFRSADGAGFDKVFCAGYTPVPPDRRIEKVSLGAENYMTWEKIEDTDFLCRELKKKGVRILALEQTPTSENIFHFLPEPTDFALILGNEVEGITPEILKLAERHLKIPMYGEKSSLNVSVAAGIAFYALNHQ